MTTHTYTSPRHLSDSDLITRLKHLAGRERQVTACLIAHLAELEERHLHVAAGCASMFTYCTQVLHLSEHAAYGRIEAARAAQKFPLILEKLADGSIHLTAVGLLAGHLTEENHRDLIREATHKTRRQVEEIVARLRPRPPVRTSIRHVPARAGMNGAGTADAAPQFAGSSGAVDRRADLSSLISAPPRSGPAGENESEGGRPGASLSETAAMPSPPARRASVEPLAPDTYRVQFTADAETNLLLRQAQELLGHQVPDGDAAAVIRLALRVLVAKLKQQKFGATKRRPPELRKDGRRHRDFPPGSSGGSGRPPRASRPDVGPAIRIALHPRGSQAAGLETRSGAVCVCLT